MRRLYFVFVTWQINTVGTTLVGVGQTANRHDTLRDLQIQTDIKHNINNRQDGLLTSGNNLYTYIRTVRHTTSNKVNTTAYVKLNCMRRRVIDIETCSQHHAVVFSGGNKDN